MDDRLRSTLRDIDLGRYIDALQINRILNWSALPSAQEHNSACLGFELGHRHRLQRELASRKSVPPWELLYNTCPGWQLV